MRSKKCAAIAVIEEQTQQIIKQTKLVLVVVFDHVIKTNQHR